MKTVGVRELKNHLSEYLRLARDGEEILVTDRGTVIAELRRHVGRRDRHPLLLEAARRGRLRLGRANGRDLYPRLAPGRATRTSAELLDETRGER